MTQDNSESERARFRLEADRDETLRRVAELEREFAGIVASAAEGSSGGDDYLRALRRARAEFSAARHLSRAAHTPAGRPYLTRSPQAAGS
jgi:hypothetical protein